MNQQQILKFWQDKKIFKKSLDKKSPHGDYVFYDGPPFATGTPHYGHIVATVMKDAVPRYWTMKGYHVERKWGWDCHGLPIENIVEKELKTKSKKDIEKMGVEKFNEACCSKVLKYAGEWKKTIQRIGRWVDMENPYQTMDLDYMESIWWVFKELWSKGLIYEGYKSMHICPRCETTLSQSEVSEGYKDIKDIAVTVKFELAKDSAQELFQAVKANPSSARPGILAPGNVYILAWTTTPWTLIGNVALAVGKDIDYVLVSSQPQPHQSSQYYILAKDQLPNLPHHPYKIIRMFKGQELTAKKYQPLFDYYLKRFSDNPQSSLYTVVTANFVTTEEGTGIVHIAPAFGEDDMNLSQEKNLPFIQHVNMDGTFKDEVKDFAGLHVKPVAPFLEKEGIGGVFSTDKKIIDYLKKKNLLFSQKEYEHSYPHCWRCETPLLNYATSSYFVNVAKLKPKLLKFARQINWSPAHIKEGRFGKWLSGARDWSVSRQRFWATVIPIWKCGNKKCSGQICVGSLKELAQKAISPKKAISLLKKAALDFPNKKDLATFLHRPHIDQVKLKCEKCQGIMSRIPDVLDCWFESGSMPYAQMHYPFENKKKFEENFPAQFIAEGADQTRTWFYYLHVIAGALFEKPAFENVIVNGIVLAADGKKMAKRLKNYPEPDLVIDKYGADALRFYLLASPVMAAENFNFSEAGVKEAYQKVIMLLSNVLAFYKMYASNHHFSNHSLGLNSPDHPLDRWILAKLNILIKDVTSQMDSYDLVHSVRPIQDFVNELSTWYVRRSRGRFKGDDKKDKQAAVLILREVLLVLSKVMAPFTPFLAEQVYQTIHQGSQDPLTSNPSGSRGPLSMHPSGSRDLLTSHEFRPGSRGPLTSHEFRPGSRGPLTSHESVHLENWPKADEKFIDKKLIEQMDLVRQIASLGLEKRASAKIPVRQPLAKIRITCPQFNLSPQSPLLFLLKDELNVMSVEWGSAKAELNVELDTKLTPELESLGIARELTRQINNLRKQKGLTIKDRISIIYETKSQKIKFAVEKNKSQILADTLADRIKEGEIEQMEEVRIKKEEIKLALR